jgi:hypothetical protein
MERRRISRLRGGTEAVVEVIIVFLREIGPEPSDRGHGLEASAGTVVVLLYHPASERLCPGIFMVVLFPLPHEARVD